MFSAEGEAKISEQFSKLKSGVKEPYQFSEEEMIERIKDAQNPQPLRPYRTEDVDVYQTLYDARRRMSFDPEGPREEDEMLDKLINRMLLSVTMTDGDGEGFGIDRAEDGLIRKPDYMERAKAAKNAYDAERKEEKDARKRAVRRNRHRRPSGDGVKAEGFRVEEYAEEDTKKLPKGSRVYVTKNNEEIITMPLESYRRFIHSEINSRALDIHEFYERQWRVYTTEKLDSLRELVTCQDHCRRLKYDLESATKDIQEYKANCEHLLKTVTTSREAKKRRRQAKKQRKTTPSDVCSEADDQSRDLGHDDVDDDEKTGSVDCKTGTPVEDVD